MSWQYHNPVRIYCGEDTASLLPGFTAGRRVLLVTTAGMLRRDMAERVMHPCSPACLHTHVIKPNPDLDELDAAADTLRPEQIDCIVALGGGSVMDSAKALSLALRSSAQSAFSRWLRDNEPIRFQGDLPLVCLPTTAGTGAEVTPFATIWDTAHKKKRSLAHNAVYPQAALLDPALTLSLPWVETRNGAFDAISHALETLWNAHATPFSLMLAHQALCLCLPALPAVEAAPHDIPERERLQTAALLAGLAISQSKTAIAHSISYPLTLHCGMPHGLACSFTIPAITALLTKHAAWRNDKDRILAQQASELLQGYHVSSAALEYCSLDEALTFANEMFTPERADNFILPAAQIPFKQILAESLHNCINR